MERTQPVHPRPAQDAADGGPAEAERMGDALAVVAQPAQGKNLFCEGRRGGARRSVRARRLIAQTSGSGLTEATHPLGGRFRADVEAGCGQLQRQSMVHNLSGKQLSTES